MPRFCRPPRGPRVMTRAPGDEGPCVLRPAGLDRPLPEVHLVSLQHHLPAGRGARLARGHREHLPEDGKGPPRLAKVPGRVRLAEEGEQLADLAQGIDALRPHRARDPAPGPEEVGEHRDPMPGRPLEEERGASAPKGAVADRSHLQARVDLRVHAHEVAGRLQIRDEAPEVPVAVPGRRRRGGGRNRGGGGAHDDGAPPAGPAASGYGRSPQAGQAGSRRTRTVRTRIERASMSMSRRFRPGGTPAASLTRLRGLDGPRDARHRGEYPDPRARLLRIAGIVEHAPVAG